MINHDYIYRPVWTCGRYDDISRSAILYNLLEGINYFFEDHSAVIVGKILSLERGGGISVTDLSSKTEVPKDLLFPFLHELRQMGLVSFVPMTTELINKYRGKKYF